MLSASKRVLQRQSGIETDVPSGIQQAGIRIEKPEEFEQLRSALERVFAAAECRKLSASCCARAFPIRDFDRVLREKLLEQADATLAKTGNTAQALYDALTVSDQAQMREFYLTALEDIDLPLRREVQQTLPVLLGQKRLWRKRNLTAASRT